MEFNNYHYELLLPLKQKWETFKLNQHAYINLNDRKPMAIVLKEVLNIDADWCCAETIINNLKQAMIRFDKFEAGNITKPVKVAVDSKTYHNGFEVTNQTVSNPKVLIIVQSSNKHPYDLFMKAQKETWADDNVIFYTAEMLGCSSGYDMQMYKTKLILDRVANRDFDFVFNTHASSYVNKKLLIDVAKTLPRSKCFAGSSGNHRLHPHRPEDFVSGSGHFFSRDVVDIVRRIVTPEPCVASDVILSAKLKKQGIPINISLGRIDYRAETTPQEAAKFFHVRFNNLSPVWNAPLNNEERMRDIYRMRKFHEYMKQKQSVTV